MMPMQAPPPHQQFNPYMGGVQIDPNSRPGAGGPPANFSYAATAPSQSFSPRIQAGVQLHDAPLPPNLNHSLRNALADPSSSAPLSDPSNNPPSAPRYRRPRPDTEEIKRVGRSHYVELLSFLRSHLAKVEQTGPRSNAREKLTRLSKQQFTELSTDVYDELMRRQNNAKNGSTTPFLAVRDEFHPKRNQARQKLATLPKSRFKDLASDVFFELERRFPELKSEFRPEAIAREREREAREKDQAERKGNIGDPQPSTTDRVVPAKSTLVEEDIAVPYSSSKSNATKLDRASNGADLDRSISPNRDSMGSTGIHNPADNRSTMYSQVSSVGTGFFNGYTNSVATQSVASPNLGRSSGFETSASSAFAMEKIRSDYELRVAKLQQQVSSLEAQNSDSLPRARKAEELSGRNQELERQLIELQTELKDEKERCEQSVHTHQNSDNNKQIQINALHQELNTLKEGYAALERTKLQEADSNAKQELETLHKEFAQQEQVVAELKQQVSSLLQELRQLSARNDEMLTDKDSDLSIIQDLHTQISSYKRKYESAKTQLRNLKATSQLYVQPPKADDFMPASEKGAIADVNLTAFQSSIDELLAAARSKTPSSVLLSMKTVVLSTTLVTEDVAKYEQIATNMTELSPEEHDQLLALKSKCSATLNNLMTACRNHASSHGLSPVSLLDAAASHVSTTIVDLVKLVKVRKASKVETENFQANFGQNGTLQNGLKPLHISVQSREAAPSGGFSPNTPNTFAFGGLNPNSAANDDRFSPRLRHSPTMGRYSPVGYKADVIRRDSGGGASWRSRAASISSSSSAAPAANIPTLPESNSMSWSKKSSVGPGGLVEADGSPTLSGINGSGVPRSETLDSMNTATSGSGGFGSQSGEENWAELRNYIEVQTEAIVHSIQALLSAIREGAQGVQLNENLTQITTIVSSIVAISKGNLPAKSRIEGEKILDELTDNCERLSDMQSHPTFDKSTKSAMASASYGVAKGLKALNGLLNDVDL